MGSIEKWTAKARSSQSNSVLFAVPARSHDGSSTWIYALDFADVSVPGAVFGVGVMGIVAARTGIRRIKNRRKRFGEREVNDRVVIVFFDDRVDLFSRPPMLTRFGSSVGSFPIELVTRPEASVLEIDGTSWSLPSGIPAELSSVLAEHDLHLTSP